MEIINDTNEDAKVRVSGGPGNVPKGGQLAQPLVVELPLGPKATLKMDTLRSTPLPPLPWTVHVSVEVGKCEVKSAAAVKRLTLTKASNNGYKFLPSAK